MNVTPGSALPDPNKIDGNFEDMAEIENNKVNGKPPTPKRPALIA